MQKSLERFEAWWDCELIDRPVVSAHVVRQHRYDGPVSRHSSLRERWLDVEYNVRSAIAGMRSCICAGDAFPAYHPNVGPELTATLLGCELEFSETTSWSVPIVHEPAGWSAITDRPLDFDNIYWQTIEAMTDLALELAGDDFIVGVADLHGNYDNLASLRDPTPLCTDLLDCPDAVRRAGVIVRRAFREAFERLWPKIRDAGMPCTTWTRYLSCDAAYLPSCDFWCVVSPQIARDYVWPDIADEMAVLQRSLFHLDGPDALRHLDLVLDLPGLNGVQWVYGAGNGPAAKWLDVYRRIRAAGKCIQVVADDADDALTVLDACGPEGVWLCVGEAFNTLAEADAFIAEVGKHAVKR